VVRENQHARGGDPDDRAAVDRFGLRNPPYRFPGDAAHDDQKDDRIDEGRKDRGAPQAVGAAFGRQGLAEVEGAPGDQQSEHVAQVVGRVGEQRQRIRRQAVENLQCNEAEVESHADGEYEVISRRHMRMPVAMVVVMVVVVRHVAR